MGALEIVLGALASNGSEFKANGAQQGVYAAQCPVTGNHKTGDKNPSLSVSNGGGKVLIHCHRGCRVEEILGAIGLTAADLFDDKREAKKPRILDEYPYVDESGKLLFHTIRFEPKDFRQRRADGKWTLQDTRRVLYRLPDVIHVAKEGGTVYVCEGEKDCDRFNADPNLTDGLVVATCNPMGAGKWRPEYSEWLRGAHVVVVADKDEPGRAHARTVSESLAGIAATVRVVEAAVGKDLHDHLSAGKSLQDLVPVAVEAAEKAKETDWFPPVDIFAQPLPALPPECLPGWFGQMVQSCAYATETPIEMSLMVGLGVLAAAAQKTWCVRPEPGYFEPLNLFTLAALPSGNRKTSVLSAMTGPLIEWESRERDRIDPIARAGESERKVLESRVSHLRARAAKEDEAAARGRIQRELCELEARISEPIRAPQIWTDDVTPERLAMLLAEHNERMAILSAEGGIFDTMAGRYSSGIPNIDVFLKGHSGEAMRVDRAGRLPVFLRHPALTVALSPQPDVLRSLVSKPGFRGRGLLARFLYAIPPAPLGYRLLDVRSIRDEIAADYQRGLFRMLGTKPQPTDEGPPRPWILTFSRGAWAAWKEFQMRMEVQLREGEPFENATDWGSKAPGAAARIAGLFHLVNHAASWPGQAEVDEDTMGRALTVMAVLCRHALAAFELMGADLSMDLARKTWRWVLRSRAPAFTARDCWRAMRGSVGRAAEIEPALEILVERGYVRETEHTARGAGRPTRKYEVNPWTVAGWN